MNLSIITACIPSMKPLFNMLQFSLVDASVPLTARMFKLESNAHQSESPMRKIYGACPR